MLDSLYTSTEEQLEDEDFDDYNLVFDHNG